MNFEINNIIKVSSMREIPALEIVWTRPVDSGKASQVYNAVLQKIEQQNIKHLILDFRKHSLYTAEDESWLYTEFAPRLIATFGSHINLAYVLHTTDYNQKLQTEGGPDRLENYSEILRINYFNCREKAVNWIAGKLAA